MRWTFPLHSIPELVHLLSIMCCSSLNETEFYLQNLLKMSFPNALVTESKKIIYWRSIGVIVFFEVNHLYCDENSAAITEIFCNLNLIFKVCANLISLAKGMNRFLENDKSKNTRWRSFVILPSGLFRKIRREQWIKMKKSFSLCGRNRLKHRYNTSLLIVDYLYNLQDMKVFLVWCVKRMPRLKRNRSINVYIC